MTLGGIGRLTVNGKHCESFYAKPNYVVSGSPDVDGTISAKFHAVYSAERYDQV